MEDFCPIVPAACDQANAIAIALDAQAVVVIFDFVEAAGTFIPWLECKTRTI
jgi:hypothetical protein